MTPMLGYSHLTGSVFVVTRWSKDGRRAITKYDVTEQFKDICYMDGWTQLPMAHHVEGCPASDPNYGGAGCNCVS